VRNVRNLLCAFVMDKFLEYLEIRSYLSLNMIEFGVDPSAKTAIFALKQRFLTRGPQNFSKGPRDEIKNTCLLNL
jgi:hypothetical protein